MKIPLTARPELDDECLHDFKYAIGRFIWTFAEIERVIFYSLITTLGMPIDIAKAVFTDARIDKAKHHIKRLRMAKGLSEDKILNDVFNHLSEITRLRNDIAHYGASHESGSTFKVSDELWKLEGARIYLVRKDDIENAISDLLVIRTRLAIYMIAGWTEPTESKYVPFQWRYKPSPLIRQPSNASSKAPKQFSEHRSSDD